MKRRLTLSFTVLAVLGLMAALASPALATPGKSSSCSNCHDGVNVPVTATLVSATAASSVYNVSAPTAGAIAVFDGATKLATFSATSGQFSVAPGKTYVIFAVRGPGTSAGLGSTSVSPVAPVVDKTPPVTTSNAVATYVSTASIKLTATDAGTGVAATYYKLDGGAQVTGTTINVSTAGAHSIEFWSVDKSGNAESPHKTASFTITTPPDVTAPVTTSNAKATYVSNATITLTATDPGSGVAATYYILDSGAQMTGKTINVNTIGAHTIEFWSVDVKGNTELPKTAAFTITAPVPDTTAPTTKSDAVATYYNSAAVHLTATDNAAGSGVAHTYYILDSGAQAEGTTASTSVLGSHTLEFWSVDASANVEAHKTATFEVVEMLTPPTTVYRFFNRTTGSHFYTASASERDSVLASGRSQYALDGLAFTINAQNPQNSAPLYRFYNVENGTHFYTASGAEKNLVMKKMDDRYSYDGPAYNVSTNKTAGAITVYRFYNKTNGSHFYTSSEAEKANVVDNLDDTYEFDGPAYYLAP